MREELNGVLDGDNGFRVHAPGRQELVLSMIGFDQFFRPSLLFVLQSPPLRDVSKDQDNSLQAALRTADRRG